jgi:hypothetical protein
MGRHQQNTDSSEVDTKAMVTIYKAVVQEVLLYGVESWFLMTARTQKLETFHYRYAHFITGQHNRNIPDGSWMYPPSTKGLESAGHFSILEYISHQKLHTYETNLSAMYNIKAFS